MGLNGMGLNRMGMNLMERDRKGLIQILQNPMGLDRRV